MTGLMSSLVGKVHLFWPCLSAQKLIIGFMALFSSHTQHTVLSQVPAGQILSVMCQRAGTESLLVHQGPCHTDLKSQMRSHSGKNGESSQWTRTATFLHMQWHPRKSWRERKQLLPAATHQQITPVTSYTPHLIWNAVARQGLNGIADAFLHVCWLFRHMFCLLTHPRKSTSLEKRLEAKIVRDNQRATLKDALR